MVPPKETVGKADLAGVRLVVLSADMVLPDELAGRIAALVRGGGGLLVVHTSEDPNFWWNAYRRVNHAQPNPSPLWDVLPFTLVPITDQETAGIRNPFGPTRVLRQAGSPLLAGVDLTQAPAFPRHGFMVLPTHPIVQGTHLMFGWSEDQYKSPLWGNGQVLAWGDDPEQRPLLLCAEYGAGRGAAAAVPLFDPAFLKWPGSKTLIGNLTHWLLGGNSGQSEAVSGTLRVPLTVGTRSVPDTEVYGVGLPWIVKDSLRRMGLRVTNQAAGAAGAVVYGVPTAEQAQAVAALAKAGKPVVVANPEALEVAPLELSGVARCRPPRPARRRHASEPPTPTHRYQTAGQTRRSCSTASGPSMPDNVGMAQGWFTPEGAARAKWVAAADLPEGYRLTSAMPHVAAENQDGPRRKNRESSHRKNRKAHSAKSPAAHASQDGISWSKTYRWRLEGNLLDRRDFVEGWERPDYDDSAWAEQTFGQNPPSPKLLGRQTPAQSLLAGAVWARAKLTLANPPGLRASGWCRREQPQFVTLLDGKPLRQKVELRTLSAGEHVVALRAWPLHAIGSAAQL